MADDSDLVERTGTMDGKPFKIRVNKNLTDDEVKRRISAQRMQPSQTDFPTDVGYGIAEGSGALGGMQLGEEIAKKGPGGKLFVTYDVARQFPGYNEQSGAKSDEFAARIVHHIKNS